MRGLGIVSVQVVNSEDPGESSQIRDVPLG